ncbi:hypothetical protein [uncultured Tateyamaria sp.]|uniref:hypothetical protein n=1 Tax=uncultured Tateyamaria sp. TaxID=455651 RepID=UPI0026352DC0|nr:hypothetical protein [uncultured Tateyamaria sp.]
MHYRLTYLGASQDAENTENATVREGSDHQFLTVIDGMIASGVIKFDDDIEGWQGFPDGEGFGKPHQAAQFLSATKQIAKREQFVFPGCFELSRLMDKAASGTGPIYVSYS